MARRTDAQELQDELSSLRGMKKPPVNLSLAVRSIGALLGLDAGGNAAGVYAAALQDMGEEGAAVADRVADVDPGSVSIAAADAVFELLQDPHWDLEGLRERGWPFIAAVAERVEAIYEDLAAMEGRKPIIAPKVVVSVDGSRMSYTAFDVAVQLRGHGSLTVLHVTDPFKDYLPPQLNPTYLENDFYSRCVQSMVPEGKYEIVMASKPEGEKTRRVVESQVYELGADILVLGAFGRKGPSIFAIGSTTDYCVRSMACTTVVVKPSSVVLRSHQSAVFVVAVDHSEAARAAFRTALSLMRPEDSISVFHVRVENPQDPEDTASDELCETYERMLELSLVTGNVVLQEKMPNKSAAQQISIFVEEVRATYLVMGIDGMGAFLRGQSWIGSVSDACVRTAKCTTILAKRDTYNTQ